MGDQATIAEPRIRRDAPTKAVARGVGELGADIFQLAELQAELAREDLRVAIRTLAKPALCVGLSVVFAAASFPILLIAIAELLVQYGNLARGWSYLIVGAGTLTAASISAVFASRGIFSGFSVFHRSKQELIYNLQWLKKIWRKPAPRDFCPPNSDR